MRVTLFERTKAEIRAEDELAGEIRIAAGETPALASLARAIARLLQATVVPRGINAEKSSTVSTRSLFLSTRLKNHADGLSSPII